MLGNEHPDTLSSMHNMASALRGMWQLAEAASLLVTADTAAPGLGRAAFRPKTHWAHVKSVF